ncbi:MAG TPA: Ku protein [Terriglobales bacterium]|nr:Ku protein [Terriglobales bacterium]
MASTVWKGHLTFGLVSLPVKLYSAARAETVSFNQLHKSDHSRIKNVVYCQLEDKPVPRAELVKGYEYEKDKYVVIDEEDIKKAAPQTAKTMEILEFVKTAEVDPIFFESSYYLAPDDAGEKPYALLFEALRRTGYVAVARIAMHNREHVVILRPGPKGILMHTMYYRDEIRQVEEFRTNTSLVKDKELALATNLIESLEASFEPDKYKDGYRESLMAMIQAKVEGREVVEAAAPSHLAPVVDILEALKMSIAQAKKPVRSAGPSAAPVEEEAPAKSKRGRKTGS